MDVGSLFKTKKKQTNRKTDYGPMSILHSDVSELSQNTVVSSLSLLQEIFPTQGLNTGLPIRRRILYQLSYKGSPRVVEWIAFSYSSRSSQPRNCSVVSCIAGRFFTNWAIREGWNNTNYIFSWKYTKDLGSMKPKRVLNFRKWENIERFNDLEGVFFVWDDISKPHLWEVWVTVSSSILEK